ncbi:MAG: hypothetical protein M3R17_10720 [Bacteroidota bacterium]|nr:hypothetical protein [Bacteroidota bacterium]
MKLYSQLKEMKQTTEVKQLRKQVEETLYYNLKFYHLELSAIGEVMGFDRLRKEMEKAMQLIDIVEQSTTKKKK